MSQRTPLTPTPSPGGRGAARLRIALVWTGVAFFIATQRYLRGPSLQPRLALPWSRAVAASAVTAFIWALLTPLCMRAARRFRPRHGAFVRNTLGLAAAGVAAALGHLLATNLFWSAADEAGRGPDFVATFLATLAFGGAARLATFVGIAGVTWAIDDFHAYRDHALQASELERELVGTQLETLKLRLHPGFLFNTLATILPLIRTDPRAAARTVVQLGDVLRLALHNDAASLVPLKAELDVARLYLQIEQTRLKDRLEVVFAIAPEALDAAVPNLVLLPLCEGAIANGASARAGRARVVLRARVEGDVLHLEVDEAPAGPSAGTSAAPLDDSFLRRTKRRLELLYPTGHGVAISDKLEKGHEVALWLPYAPVSESTLPAEGAA
ncbi:MAG TPA: histidine kinase [Thermoanaerobaculia bacterium]|nr:histidine kinase [Thermoanaerobaculia bacterium]